MLSLYQQFLINYLYEIKLKNIISHKQFLHLLMIADIKYDDAYNHYLNDLCDTKNLDFTPPTK